MMPNFNGYYIPLFDSNFKIAIFEDRKYVPVFSSQRDMQKYMLLTNGLTTGSMIVSDYLNISARLSHHGIGIVIISFKDDEPIGDLYYASGQSPLPPYSKDSS